MDGWCSRRNDSKSGQIAWNEPGFGSNLFEVFLKADRTIRAGEIVGQGTELSARRIAFVSVAIFFAKDVTAFRAFECAHRVVPNFSNSTFRFDGSTFTLSRSPAMCGKASRRLSITGYQRNGTYASKYIPK